MSSVLRFYRTMLVNSQGAVVSETILDRAFEHATRAKDDDTLSWLASFEALPPSLSEKLAKNRKAAVRSAWYANPTTDSPDKFERIKNERAASALVTVLASSTATAAAKEACANNKDPLVLAHVAYSREMPEHLRRQALVNLPEAVTATSKTKLSELTEYTQRRALPPLDMSTARLPEQYTSLLPSLDAALATMPGISDALAVRLITTAWENTNTPSSPWGQGRQVSAYMSKLPPHVQMLVYRAVPRIFSGVGSNSFDKYSPAQLEEFLNMASKWNTRQLDMPSVMRTVLNASPANPLAFLPILLRWSDPTVVPTPAPARTVYNLLQKSSGLEGFRQTLEDLDLAAYPTVAVFVDYVLCPKDTLRFHVETVLAGVHHEPVCELFTLNEEADMSVLMPVFKAFPALALGHYRNYLDSASPEDLVDLLVIAASTTSASPPKNLIEPIVELGLAEQAALRLCSTTKVQQRTLEPFLHALGVEASLDNRLLELPALDVCTLARVDRKLLPLLPEVLDRYLGTDFSAWQCFESLLPEFEGTLRELLETVELLSSPS